MDWMFSIDHLQDACSKPAPTNQNICCLFIRKADEGTNPPMIENQKSFGDLIPIGGTDNSAEYFPV